MRDFDQLSASHRSVMEIERTCRQGTLEPRPAVALSPGACRLAVFSNGLYMRLPFNEEWQAWVLKKSVIGMSFRSRWLRPSSLFPP